MTRETASLGLQSQRLVVSETLVGLLTSFANPAVAMARAFSTWHPPQTPPI
jgi:hypothetical protein